MARRESSSSPLSVRCDDSKIKISNVTVSEKKGSSISSSKSIVKKEKETAMIKEPAGNNLDFAAIECMIFEGTGLQPKGVQDREHGSSSKIALKSKERELSRTDLNSPSIEDKKLTVVSTYKSEVIHSVNKPKVKNSHKVNENTQYPFRSKSEKSIHLKKCKEIRTDIKNTLSLNRRNSTSFSKQFSQIKNTKEQSYSKSKKSSITYGKAFSSKLNENNCISKVNTIQKRNVRIKKSSIKLSKGSHSSTKHSQSSDSEDWEDVEAVESFYKHEEQDEAAALEFLTQVTKEPGPSASNVQIELEGPVLWGSKKNIKKTEEYWVRQYFIDANLGLSCSLNDISLSHLNNFLMYILHN